MKKSILKFFVLSATIFGSIISCSKDNSKAEQQDPNKLSEDNAFIELTTETYDYLLFISKTASSSKLSQPVIQTKLTELQNRNLPFTEQMTSIDVIFKGSISQRLKKHMEVYSRNWSIIQSKYSSINKEVLEKECTEVLENIFLKKYVVGTTFSSSSTSNCGWKYYLCAAAATAGAILCHSGCAGATLGLGIPACIILCGTAQAYAIVLCEESHCEKDKVDTIN